MAPIARILVPVTGSARDATALATAIELATPFHAHIEALFAWPDPQSAVPQVGVPFATEVFEAICSGQAMQSRECEKAANKFLAGICAEKRIRLIDEPALGASVTCSMRSETGSLPMVLSHSAQYSDLVVFPPLGMPGYVDIIAAFLSVLTQIERPVVVACEDLPKRRTASAAIAWNGSKSAARAVMAAIPFLRTAQKVFVLEVAESDARSQTDGIEQYLALNGIKAVRKSARLGPPSVGDRLTQEAAELGADILVMGGYGHSHLRETFFGGVTADVLARATMPVFLMH